MAKKEKSGIEIIENSEALRKEVFKVEGFFERNQKAVLGVVVVILALVAGAFGYNYWNKGQEKEAQVAMFDAVNSFEADSTSQALKGQGGNEGLESVADNYSSTKGGNLANMYAGIAFMKEGKFNEAIGRLEKFSANDDVLQPRAYTLIGDSYLELGKADDAIKYYKKAVDYKPNKFATPGYMMKLGIAYQEAKNNSEAVKVYASVIDKYPSAIESVLAKKYKSKLEAELGGN
ncbi:MAG: tetratricopeptide repeat protein [Leadbetterella sp.]|nr:tetratricopeptide repeat protein [Leadbetterella sp.]